MLIINNLQDIKKRLREFTQIRKLPLNNGTTLNIIDAEGIRYWNTTIMPQDIKEVQFVFIESNKEVFPKSKCRHPVVIDGKTVEPLDTIELLQVKFENKLKQDTDSLQFGVQLYVYKFEELRVSITLLPDNQGVRNINFTQNTTES
ncbi:MAG TPA: hypothetical protein VL947_07905 [Cytophagales bacterium]|nr:hypothetical protein [Cytophagales bacterium]